MLDAADWGSIADWVGGLATAGGLIFTGLEIRASSRERREQAEKVQRAEEERRTALARSVGVNATFDQKGDGTWTIEYTLHNGGDYPIDDVVLVFADPAQEWDLANQQGTCLELVVGTVMPKQTLKDKAEGIILLAEPVFGELTRMAGALFTDTWDQYWYRALGLLERREHPPRIC